MYNIYMSIATLKKKTAAKYHNSSVGVPLFSLNGGHRSQGYVGQTNLSRSLPRTLWRGGAMRNSGGCSGTFTSNSIISAVNSTEDPSVIKESSINTLGLIHEKYAWIFRPQPYTSVKPDVNQNINDQGQRLRILRNGVIKDANSCYEVKTTDNTGSCATSSDSLNNNKKCTYSKPESDYVAMSQGEYMLQLSEECDSTINTVSVADASSRRGVPLPGN